MQAADGIACDSVPELDWGETEAKAQALTLDHVAVRLSEAGALPRHRRCGVGGQLQLQVASAKARSARAAGTASASLGAAAAADACAAASGRAQRDAAPQGTPLPVDGWLDGGVGG